LLNAPERGEGWRKAAAGGGTVKHKPRGMSPVSADEGWEGGLLLLWKTSGLGTAWSLGRGPLDDVSAIRCSTGPPSRQRSISYAPSRRGAGWCGWTTPRGEARQRRGTHIHAPQAAIYVGSVCCFAPLTTSSRFVDYILGPALLATQSSRTHQAARRRRCPHHRLHSGSASPPTRSAAAGSPGRGAALSPRRRPSHQAGQPISESTIPRAIFPPYASILIVCFGPYILPPSPPPHTHVHSTHVLQLFKKHVLLSPLPIPPALKPKCLSPPVSGAARAGSGVALLVWTAGRPSLRW
jgi:hypothetical protein